MAAEGCTPACTTVSVPTCLGRSWAFPSCPSCPAASPAPQTPGSSRATKRWVDGLWGVLPVRRVHWSQCWLLMPAPIPLELPLLFCP